jgi:hypothetical protein
MICSSCGGETPNDSRFCRMCGDSYLVAPTAGGAARGRRGGQMAFQLSRVAFVMAGILLLAGGGYYYYAYYAYRTSYKRRSDHTANLLDRLTKKPHSVPVSSDPVAINQLAYTYFKLDVPAKASSVLLKGTFIASGGTGNTVEAFLFPETDYVNWQNRHAATPLYSSGKVTMGAIETELPAGAGSYYLVFNNKFSVLDSKTVHVDAALTYYQ